MNRQINSASRLHQYLMGAHWNGDALIGPDPGIRINYRIGRFVKSYLRAFAWNDGLYYVQGQGYWILANWLLHAQSGDPGYREVALACSRNMLQQQGVEGEWEYPNPEWRGRIATAEGTWASIALIESYRQTQDSTFLDGVMRWNQFLTDRIGFQDTKLSGDESQLAVNYFAGRTGTPVPNNTAFVLRFFAELYSVTGDESILKKNDALLSFLGEVQKDSGELPYTVAARSGKPGKDHFQCYQYNAFQCLDLQRFYILTLDSQALALVKKLLNFLATGLAGDGHALYECGSRYRAVTYHAAVLGAAFAGARPIGIPGYDNLSTRAFQYTLKLQRSDGGFPYSQRDYFVLHDRRSYPRYLAMILYHLLSSGVESDKLTKFATIQSTETPCESP